MSSVGVVREDAMARDPAPSTVPRTTRALATALREARDYTLSLYAHLDLDRELFPLRREVNPARWELGHIGWFQEYWCLRDGPRGAALHASLHPGADALWNSSLVPHDARWTLPLPRAARLHAYLEETLHATLGALDARDGGDRYFFELALYHEDMHGEALLMTLQTLGLPPPGWLRVAAATGAAAPASSPGAGDLRIPAHDIDLGSRREEVAERFVFDNEKWAHRVHVPAFGIARRCVTNDEFRAFVDDGGYLRADLWTDEGWAWLASVGRAAPAYWVRNGTAGAWHQRRFDRLVPLVRDAPVQHVNAHEAEAWCRWAGRRLPSEVEWEAAARWAGNCHHEMPVRNLDALAGGPVGVDDTSATLAHMLGNVWEWTASAFLPYPGFAPDPYADYSAPWFGNHRVLRGGSWATRARLVHARFRNFYTPERPDPFVGFRTCAVAD